PLLAPFAGSCSPLLLVTFRREASREGTARRSTSTGGTDDGSRQREWEGSLDQQPSQQQGRMHRAAVGEMLDLHRAREAGRHDGIVPTERAQGGEQPLLADELRYLVM